MTGSVVDDATLRQRRFDKTSAEFTTAIAYAADWKHNYFGAAYSTRLRQAIGDLRLACDTMQQVLDAEDALAKLPKYRPKDGPTA